MSSLATWKTRKVRGIPRTIKDIGSKGLIKESFNLGELQNIRTTKGTVIFEFKIGGEKPTLFDAWSNRNYNDGKANIKKLQKNHSYVVKGILEAVGRSVKYDKSSSSNSKYKIRLGKIEILSKEVIPSSSTKEDVTLDVLRKYIRTHQYGNFELKKLKLLDGELYRYWGCEKCFKSISGPLNRSGKYSCTQCAAKGGVKGRICTIARNIKVGDVDVTRSQNELLSDLVIYHNDVESILGKELMTKICSSYTDKTAKEAFQKFIGGNFDGVIAHQRGSSTKTASVILKNINWTTPILITTSADSEVEEDDADTSQESAQFSATEDDDDRNVICGVCKNFEDEDNENDDDIDDDNVDSNIIHECELPSTSVRNNTTNIIRALNDEGAGTMRGGMEGDGVDSGIDDIENTDVAGVYLLAGSKAGSGNYGLALIINIDSVQNQGRRKGSLKDVQALEKIFPELKIDIFQGGAIHNPTLKENGQYKQVFSNVLKEFKSELVKKDYRSCFVIYMGHGQQNLVKLADGGRINVYLDIMWEFSEEKLEEFANRPKIFIFAACQGVPDGPKGFTMPTSSPMAHMLWVTPCLPGQPSKRNKQRGTYFIQALVRSLRRNKTEQLSEILLRMQQEMKRVEIGDHGYFIPNYQNRCFAQFLFPG